MTAELEVGQKLATHPDGAHVVVYREDDGRIGSAFYVGGKDGDFVRPHPEGGWGVTDPKGRLRPLRLKERQHLGELAQLLYQTEEPPPPLITVQAGLLEAIDVGHLNGHAGDARLVAVTLADVEPEQVRWLWKGRLPRGKLVVGDGDPALGKSTIAVDLAARISTGSPMPDGERLAGPEDVVLMSAEDGLADTIVPRLLAAGGDPTRVHAVTDVVDVDDGARVTRPPVLPDDIAQLEGLVNELAAGLVVVDVLNAYLSARVNSFRDQDIRRALHPLSQLADRTGATVLVLRHLNKGGDTNPLYRGGGSIGITAAARTGLLVAADPDDETGARRILAVTKSNLAAMPPALAYRLVPDDLHACARVEWEGATSHTAAQLLALPASDEERSAGDEAVEFIHGFIGQTSQRAGDVVAAARKAGIAERTLARARKRAGVVSRREGFGPGSTVWWSIDLATYMPTDPHTCHSRQASDLGRYGKYEGDGGNYVDGEVEP